MMSERFKIRGESKKKKILFVAMLNSIHAARWLSQFDGCADWDVHIFPSTINEAHLLIKNNPNITIHYSDDNDGNCSLKKVIEDIKPDIVHTLEMQHAAYKVLPIKQKKGDSFPLWFYSCWGSDINWFEQFPEDKEKIIQVLNRCDAFFCEDKQTIDKVIESYNFKKPILNVQATGGLRANYFRSKFKFIPPSKRNYIVVKGYSGWVYKPETVFEAIKLCYKEILDRKLKIVVYLSGDVQRYIDELLLLGLEVETFKHTQDYDQVMELFAGSKINVAASLSDGISNSMLEGMLMGAFPIQSIPSLSGGAAEYIVNGKNGVLLDPLDVKGYAEAIVNAISNDKLLDDAANYNFELIRTRLEYSIIRDKVLKFYNKFFSNQTQKEMKAKRKFNPLVSIIIPVYNGSNFVREAIDSALAQTYKNIEIIVVNDGSTDNTEEIVKSYGKRIKYYKKKNGGVATALNLGIEKANGEYFSWLSHDDLYTPEKIELEVLALKGNGEDAVVFCDWMAIDKDGNFISCPKTIKEASFSMRAFLALEANHGLHGNSLLIPKSIISQVGNFNSNLEIVQDYDLWFRLSLKCRFIYVDHQLVLGRDHPKQVTHFKKEKVIIEADAIHSRFVDDLVDEDLDKFVENLDYYIRSYYSYRGLEYKKTARSILQLFLRCKKFNNQEEIISILAKELDNSCNKNLILMKTVNTYNGGVSKLSKQLIESGSNSSKIESVVEAISAPNVTVPEAVNKKYNYYIMTRIKTWMVKIIRKILLCTPGFRKMQILENLIFANKNKIVEISTKIDQISTYQAENQARLENKIAQLLVAQAESQTKLESKIEQFSADFVETIFTNRKGQFNENNDNCRDETRDNKISARHSRA